MRALLLLLLTAPAFAGPAPAPSPWPMAGATPTNASTSPYAGPSVPKLSWIRTDSSDIARKYMGVVLGSDGTLYVGGRRQFRAINPDGTEKWNIPAVTFGPQDGDTWGTPAVGNDNMVYISTPRWVGQYDAGTGVFVGSATLIFGSDAAGGGLIRMANDGRLWVGHGDETAPNTFGGTDNTLFRLDPNLRNINGMTRTFHPSRAGPTLTDDNTIVLLPRFTISTDELEGYKTDLSGSTTTPVQFDSVPFVNDRPGQSISILPGDFMVIPINDQNNLCPSVLPTRTHLAAVNVKNGGLVWNKCEEFGQQSMTDQDRFFAAIASHPATVYVMGMRAETLYRLGPGGVTEWSYDLNSLGMTVDNATIGPMTLAGSTIYFTYCSNAKTRLAAINGDGGARLWDIPLSNSSCFSGQPVPGTNNRMYVYNGPELIALESSAVNAITVASSPAAAFGSESALNYWYSTMTVTALSGALPVSSGVVVEVNHFQTTSVPGLTASITPSVTSYLVTDTSSRVSMPVQYILTNSLTAASMHGIVSTVSFRSPGAAPQTFQLKETRVSTVAIATTTALVSAGGIRTSSMTITVRDGSGAAVPDVPCVSRDSNPVPYPGSASMTANPNNVVWTTNGSGVATISFHDDLAGFSNANYSVYAVTHTVACLGQPPQQIVMRESRVASVSFATGTPVMQGLDRVWTVTATLLDGASNPVPDVPVALAAQSVPMPATVIPSAVAFTTATNTLGQATFQVREAIDQLDPNQWPALVSTYTLRILSNPSVPLYLKEERVASVTVATGTPTVGDGGMGNDFRVITATITVLDAASNPIPSLPVALKELTYSGLASYVPNNVGGVGFVVTNAVGVATVTIQESVLDQIALGFADFAVFNASYTVNLPSTPREIANTRETRAASYATTVSSSIINAELRYATFTVTVRDGASNPVPYVPVAISTYSRHFVGTPAASQPYLIMDPAIGTFAAAFTDAQGQAHFTIKINANGGGGDQKSLFDTFDDSYSSATIVPLNLAYSTAVFFVESNKLDHYAVDAPTSNPVGIAFVSTVTARNKWGVRLSSYTETGIQLTPLFAGTEVQGTGTLGTSLTGAFTAGRVIISSQTYNKVEQINIKASRSTDGKSGRSGTLDVTGPTAFLVHVPTAATAGNAFSMSVEAVDALGRRVIGYTATLALSALQASNTAQAGAGILGTTNVNLPGNGIVTIANQTYTKAEQIVIRAVDSGSNILGTSTNTLNVRAGTPVSLTLNANPQSTIASVPSVLSSEVQDLFGNKVVGATITYSVPVGSGVVSLSFGQSGAASTQAVTGALGTTSLFFVSTNSLSSQANIVRAQLGALTTDTTIYNSVLITPAGGTIVNLDDPRIRVTVPANAWGFDIRMSAQNIGDFDAADLAMTTAAFAAAPNVFISTIAAQFTAVRDSNPNAEAGDSSTKVTIQLPFQDDGSGNVTVGAYRGASILVPFSVLRVFKLNEATSLFEMVLDGTNLADISSRVVTAQVVDPNGIYAIGAPAFTPLGPASSGTVTTVLAAGATAEVSVPFGAFTSATNLQVGVPADSSVPDLPTGRGIQGTGLTISIQTTNGLQPVRPVSVSIGYRAQDVVGLKPDTLRIARYDDSTGWVVLDSRVDTLQRKVVGDTDHFSLFQIVSIAPAASLSSGFVFPNPYRPAAGHTTLKFGQLPVGAKVKIYTVSGRLLKELEADATGQVLNWDAKDRDGRKLPSGVYLALIESGSDRKTLKFAIQR